MACRSMLAHALRELRANGEEVDSSALVLSETKAALVELAGELGIETTDIHPADLVRRIAKEVL
jgi:hypothetical protein